MYAFVQQSGNNAVMIFRFDHIDEAVKLLEENGLTVINGSKCTRCKGCEKWMMRLAAPFTSVLFDFWSKFLA